MADSRGTLHSYLLLLLLVTCSSGITNVGKNSWSFDLPAPEVPSEAGKEAVCANIDIRNSVEHFKKLKNCTVVEGFVQILLIERGTHHDFGNLSFPALREITGYLLLFRVRGLQSLAKLFPNLTVIRGTILFHNFAFVIYELQDIHEIGLGNFTTIVRGSVRLEKNPRLCYVDTIDWDKIAKAGTGGHYFKENRKQEECSNICPNDCPTSSLSGGVQRKLCWNYNVCQKVCSPECEHRNLTCSTKNMCCHAECLGGCSGKFSTECVACRHVKFQGMCKKECPQGTYEYLGHRCILENDCKAIKNQLPFHSNQQVTYWKPFKGECLPSCPAGYTEDSKNRHECRACDDFCPKVCDGSVINNVATAQSFKSCTYVNGSLEIQIQGGSNVIKELDDNLGSIQEINGYLKIARSYPLKSLNFLKNLEYIHGESLDKKDYAFLVLDNQNLQELWDWENRKTKLHIKRGKIFFHFNSKLCVNKIKELETNADILPFDDRDVSPNSNGDRVACNVVSMNIHVWSITASAVGLRWKNFIKLYHDVDYRSLLGYVVYYREAPQRNVTIFDGQNACGSNVWKVDDVEGNEDADDIITILTQLKPFTTYAAYMRTYTTASAARGAQSPIIYFSTKPTNPSPPVNVRAHSTNHGEIVISWDSPKKPNGNVTHYMVSGLRERDSLEFISQRNYCKSSSLPGFKKVTDDKASDNEVPWLLNGTSSPETSDAENCCSCSENTRLGAKEKDAEFQTDFEDFLHNAVYVKNPNPVNVTKKNSSKGENLVKPNTTDSPVIENTTYLFNSSLTVSPKESSDIPLNATIPSEVEVNASTIAELQTINGSRFHHIVYDKLFLVVPNLHHFTEYTIEAKACQDPYEENGPPECSSQAITTVRTLPLAGADDIDSKTLCANLENATSGTVFIKWDQPLDPNGLIVSYQLEYKPAEANEDFKPISVCVTQSEYETKMGYSLHGLLPGNYSLKVLSTSLAGNGNWTLPTYFYIPDSRDGMKQEILAVITVVVCIALSLVIGIPFYFFYKKKYGLRIPDGILYASVNPEYMSAGLVYEPDEWEVPRDKITVLEELGQGSFGMVYKGEVKDMDELRPLMKCAIKTVNETASLRERIEFLQEASVMKAFDCHHVVKLLGVVSKGHPTLVIMELMANGDLKAYLRSHRPDNENLDCTPPTLRQILQMAAEIADGMAYLAAKKFVHRDLAARNCMVAEDMTVKIGDFGMTRDIYETDYYRKGGKGLLPVRWMAPECLKDGLFSNQSDVWSYGVVLWEMATLASQPYQGLSNEQVLKFVINGGTMEKPENCPEKLYALMKLCWEHNPKARPTFNELVEILLPDIRSNKFREVSFYFTEHLEMKNRENEDITDMVSQSTPLRTRWNENYFSHENSDDDSEVHYFPSTRNVLNESILHNPQSHHSSSHNFIDIPECQDTASTTNPNGSKGLSLHSTEGSKGISVASSDSSKESKVSNCSNGSIANGHVSFATGRTTEC